MDIEKIVREYIDKTVHLSLATTLNDKPWVCEVHFAYDDTLNLYFRSLTSRRHSQNIAQNPNVAGDIIDKYALGDSVVGVFFEGRADLLGPGDERQKAFECIKSRLQADDAILAEADNPEGHQFYKIRVENWCVFGRFGQPSGQKYQLPWQQAA